MQAENLRLVWRKNHFLLGANGAAFGYGFSRAIEGFIWRKTSAIRGGGGRRLALAKWVLLCGLFIQAKLLN